jgi:dolichol-phosphate mannosyltransferase
MSKNVNNTRQLGLLSLVIPVFNEQEGLPFLRTALQNWSAGHCWPFEVVLVDDGSSDTSGELLRLWAGEDRRIRVLRLSRNFGHQAAVTAGLDASRGDAIVILDADLQDPLEVVGEMIQRYEEGYDVVYGQRLTRAGETAFKRFTAWAFYRFMSALVSGNLPPDAGDFRLISRPCADAILRMNEVHRFLRGMFAWAGFRQVAVQYHRSPRTRGTTKYPLRKMIRLAVDAALSFSILPIRVITWIGLLTAILGFVWGAYSVLRKILLHDTVQGWATLVALNALLGGIILIALGVIGEYVGRIYQQVKGRPLYLVQETYNLDDTVPQAKSSQRRNL